VKIGRTHLQDAPNAWLATRGATSEWSTPATRIDDDDVWTRGARSAGRCAREAFCHP
jgi:hypothetical protein